MSNKKTRAETKRYALIYEHPGSGFLHVLDFNEKSNGEYELKPDITCKRGEPLKGSKHTLAEIDKFTNSYKDGLVFSNYVIPQYYNEDPDNIFILYNHNGIHSLNVRFGNIELIEKAKMVRCSKIDDFHERNTLAKMLTEKDRKFISFIRDYPLMFNIMNNPTKYDEYGPSNDFINLVEETIYLKNNKDGFSDEIAIDENLYRIKDKLKDYKLFREIFVAKQDFEFFESKDKVKQKRL